MENPETDAQTRLTDDGQKVLHLPEFSQLFFDADGNFRIRNEIFGRVFKGGAGSNRLVLLCLGLLNAVLLIATVAIGINCAKVKEGSLHVSHATAKQLFSELNYLRSNHSDVMEAKEASKNAFETALGNHTQLKEKIEQLKTMNDDFFKQIAPLQTERTNLKANLSALNGNCGRCPISWILVNSSCYFFSYTESNTVRKNWQDSREDCINRGADLIVISNPEEQKFMTDMIRYVQFIPDTRREEFWIGLTDIYIEGTWTWINNVTETEQRYWMDGDPNGQRGEDCVCVVYRATSPWKTRFDSGCQHRRNWICEMNAK